MTFSRFFALSLAIVAALAVGSLAALGVRSVVADPGSAPAAAPQNPGHPYNQIELPAGTWTGLDADFLDGLDSTAFSTGPHTVDTDTQCDDATCSSLRLDDAVNTNNVLDTVGQAGAADTLFWGNTQVSLGPHISSDLSCVNCVDAGEVQFNYAGSTSEGGPATDLACANCVSAGEVQFNYAGGTSEGGTAFTSLTSLNLSCLDCVSAGEVQFNYAGSTSEGGSANNALNLTCANCVSAGEVQFNYAGSTSEGGNANFANNANLLNNLNSSQFLRSDQSDTIAGNLGVVGLLTVAGNIETTGAGNAGNALLINRDGPDQNLFIYFYEDNRPFGERLEWNNASDEFFFSDSLVVEGTVTEISDRNAKENFAVVDGQDILQRLAGMPVETWNLKSEEASVRHIGPSAQDFLAAFGLGEDERRISTIDRDGVALAAIQGLYELVQEKDAAIAALEQRLGALEGAAGGEGVASGPSSSGLPLTWLLLGGLLVASLTLGTAGTIVLRRSRA